MTTSEIEAVLKRLVNPKGKIDPNNPTRFLEPCPDIQCHAGQDCWIINPESEAFIAAARDLPAGAYDDLEPAHVD
jgi:hypothetical protein